MRRERFQRNIDAPLFKVACDVLPEIRQLQRRARRIGKPLPLRIAVAAQIKDEAAHRVRRIAAVSEDVVPGGVTVNGLVLAKRDEQIGKRLDGNVERGNGFAQRDKNGVRRFSCVAIAQFLVPLVQQRQGFGRIGNFISQIVGPAAVGVQIVKMLVQPSRKQPGNHVEIFVVMRGEPSGVALGLRDRASGRRKPACNLEFSGYLHVAGDAGEPVAQASACGV